ncbi:MAG: sugar phosphate isomerase/epimerase [Planctomycetes bacterium]|nr:sugar phosphate isomerase/epimerase [Planctomycetota bacterium]
MKKPSIGSWAYLFNQDQPTNDFHAVVHKLQHLGFQGVELFGYAPHPNPDSHDTKEKRQKLRKMVVDHRLEFSGYVPILWANKLWSVDDHGPFLADFEKNALFAEDLGIKTMRVDTVEPIANVAQVEPKLLFDRCVKAFDACSRFAAKHGITIAWEFESCFALNKPSEIVALVDRVRSLGNANFGVLFDLCNAHMCAKDELPGGALALLQLLKGKITHLHLNDSDGTLNPQSGGSHNVPLGKGVLNFDQLIPELLTCGVPDDWWTIDLCFWPDAWPATADSKRFLDKLRHKYAA